MGDIDDVREETAGRAGSSGSALLLRNRLFSHLWEKVLIIDSWLNDNGACCMEQYLRRLQIGVEST